MSGRDWMFCDGKGGIGDSKRASVPSLSRRSLLGAAAFGAVGWLSGRTALADLAINRDQKGDVLVSVFLRGGADGLNILPPFAEDAYHRERPSLSLGAPRDRTRADRAIDLDGFFGLNPALGPLEPLFKEGSLAFVHAVGSNDQSRSHFEAMNAMERGLADSSAGEAGGWLARHLAASPAGSSSPLRAVAFGGIMPDSLRGGTDAIAIDSLDDFRLRPGRGMEEGKLLEQLGQLYGLGKDAISQAGHETLQVLDLLNKLDPRAYRPSNGALYPDTPLGQGLKQVAFLIRNDVGLEVACLDQGNWDTHVAQGVTSGWLTGLLDNLGRSLAAFAADLGSEMKRVTLVVQTEFGRRVYENTGLGTDHGRASVMFLLGGGTVGGRVYGKWPGLEKDQQDEGDLRVTTDYRDVLAEVLAKRVPGADLARVFPGHSARSLGWTA